MSDTCPDCGSAWVPCDCDGPFGDVVVSQRDLQRLVSQEVPRNGSPVTAFDPDAGEVTPERHWLALNALDRIEEALFGDNKPDERSVDDLVTQAENLRRLAQFEQSVWALAWHTGRSVTLRIGGGHDVIHHLSVGGWSKEDGSLAFFVNGDLATLEAKVVAYAEVVRNRKANEPMPTVEET